VLTWYWVEARERKGSRAALLREAGEVVSRSVCRIGSQVGEVALPQGLDPPARPTAWELKAEENARWTAAKEEQLRLQREAEELAAAKEAKRRGRRK